MDFKGENLAEVSFARFRVLEVLTYPNRRFRAHWGRGEKLRTWSEHGAEKIAPIKLNPPGWSSKPWYCSMHEEFQLVYWIIRGMGE